MELGGPAVGSRDEVEAYNENEDGKGKAGDILLQFTAFLWFLLVPILAIGFEVSKKPFGNSKLALVEMYESTQQR